MNKNFFIEGNKYFSINASSIIHKLPPAVYQLNFDARSNKYYYEQTEPFSIPDKLYGDIHRTSDRIWNTFKLTDKSIGALLVGNQGSGKTLLTKLLSQKGISNNIPTIIISSPFTGEEFITSLLDIEDEAIIIFDEFEKVYDEYKEQSSLLSILDGTVNTKKLFLLTANNEYKILNTFFNRPGRIRYLLRYYKLSDDVIKEYCDDNLANLTLKDQISKLPTIIQDFSYDMLVELVRELNLYDESLEEVLSIMNIKPDKSYNENLEYDITYVKNNQIIDYCWPNNFKGNPLSSDKYNKLIIRINQDDDSENNEMENDDGFLEDGDLLLHSELLHSPKLKNPKNKNNDILISLENLESINADGTMVFKITDEITAIFKPKFNKNIFDVKRLLI